MNLAEAAKLAIKILHDAEERRQKEHEAEAKYWATMDQIMHGKHHPKKRIAPKKRTGSKV